jgi:integrase
MLLVDIQPTDVEDWLIRLKAANLSADTQVTYLRCFSQVLKTAVRDNYLQRTPMEGISKPKRSTEPRAVFKKHEIQQVLDRFRGTRYWPILTLIALTGLRVGEALALQWRDVDEQSGILTVSRTLTSVGGKLALGSPKTDRGARTIPVNAAALSAVLNCVRDHDRERMVLTIGKSNDFFFRTANNTFLDPHNEAPQV